MFSQDAAWIWKTASSEEEALVLQAAGSMKRSPTHSEKNRLQIWQKQIFFSNFMNAYAFVFLFRQKKNSYPERIWSIFYFYFVNEGFKSGTDPALVILKEIE